MKKFPAIMAAFIVTLLIGLSMFAIGASALVNTHTTPTASTSTALTGNASAAASSAADAQQVAQLQALVQQYQARETQYQAELKQAAQQLSQANQLAYNSSTQVQSYQQILTQLQQVGLIQISQNGQITINGTNRRNNSNRGGLFGGNS